MISNVKLLVIAILIVIFKEVNSMKNIYNKLKEDLNTYEQVRTFEEFIQFLTDEEKEYLIM